MPLQNRVLPNGQIVAIPARGTFTGNRGIIHGPDRTLTRRRWSHKAWICCALDWQGRKRRLMTGRNWTELFFLDEAVALAAGHRPCGYCRRADYTRFKDAWTHVYAKTTLAPDMDRMLHATRVNRHTRKQLTYKGIAADLPVGTFFEVGGAALLITHHGVKRFTPDGYVASGFPLNARTSVNVMTPGPIVQVLHAGYTPALHPSATIDVSPPTA